MAEELAESPTNNNSLSASTTSDPEGQQEQRDEFAQDEGSDDDLSDDEGKSSDESYDALEERFHGLEEEVAILVADVHDLALYTKLNITGFMKILKVCVLLVFVFLSFLSLHFVPQKHDVRIYIYCNAAKANVRTETNQRSTENHFHPRISREAAVLQV